MAPSWASISSGLAVGAGGGRLGIGRHFRSSLALGTAIARVGCFMRGCCYGIPTDLPWGINTVLASADAPDADL